MFTSYYFAKKLDIDLLNPKFVGISLSIPSQWQHITVYPPLFPTWDLLKKWRNKEITEDEYIVVYKEILNRLNPSRVYDEVGHDSVMLCWEKPNEFCHRHIVADWLSEHLGLIIEEI